jgi:hypothetical protein
VYVHITADQDKQNPRIQTHLVGEVDVQTDGNLGFYLYYGRLILISFNARYVLHGSKTGRLLVSVLSKTFTSDGYHIGQ